MVKSWLVRHRPPLKWLVTALMVIGALLGAAWAVTPDDKLRVSFLDVGQGDAILITRGRQQILVDGGPSPETLAGELGRRLPFWDRTIELVVATHPDADHLSGLVDTLARYQVESVLTTDIPVASDVYAAWQTALEASRVPVAYARAGQVITSQDLRIEVLNPLPQRAGVHRGRLDDGSLVLRVSLGKVSFLLMGDAGAAAELALIRERADLSSTVLKVGHHGSETGTTPELLDVVRPGAVVVSVGAANRFGHPDARVMARLEARLGRDSIYRTDTDGAITFITDGDRLWVSGEDVTGPS